MGQYQLQFSPSPVSMGEIPSDEDDGRGHDHKDDDHGQKAAKGSNDHKDLGPLGGVWALEDDDHGQKRQKAAKGSEEMKKLKAANGLDVDPDSSSGDDDDRGTSSWSPLRRKGQGPAAEPAEPAAAADEPAESEPAAAASSSGSGSSSSIGQELLVSKAGEAGGARKRPRLPFPETEPKAKEPNTAPSPPPGRPRGQPS